MRGGGGGGRSDAGGLFVSRSRSGDIVLNVRAILLLVLAEHTDRSDWHADVFIFMGEVSSGSR